MINSTGGDALKDAAFITVNTLEKSMVGSAKFKPSLMVAYARADYSACLVRQKSAAYASLKSPGPW